MSVKTLYISDLDGTLLNSDASLSSYSFENLVRLCERGVYFSVASARTAATVTRMLDGLPLKVPMILMNGACIYDLCERKYVRTAVFDEETREILFKAVSGTSGFLYTVENDELHTYYERCDTPHSVKFREEREKKFGKVFTRVGSFAECNDRNPIYFSVAGEEHELRGLYEKLSEAEGIHVEYYRDIYNTDFWYLETCRSDVSKYASAMWIREKYGFDRLIGFGDNLNDLPLFAACDESYAVSGAKDEVKVKASGVIGSNDDDAVVKFMLERLSY